MDVRRSPLRILAPIALVVFGIAFLLVLANGGGGGGDGGGGSSAAEKARDLGPTVRHRSGTHTQRAGGGSGGRLPQRVYIVKKGDTLGEIAQKTGVPVSRLQDLNPGLDQFSLQTGQQIKLR